MTQTLTVNLHNPIITKAARHDSGTIVVELSNDALHGSVDVFFDGVEAVDEFIAVLQAGVAQYRFMKESA